MVGHSGLESLASGGHKLTDRIAARSIIRAPGSPGLFRSWRSPTLRGRLPCPNSLRRSGTGQDPTNSSLRHGCRRAGKCCSFRSLSNDAGIPRRRTRSVNLTSLATKLDDSRVGDGLASLLAIQKVLVPLLPRPPWKSFEVPWVHDAIRLLIPSLFLDRSVECFAFQLARLPLFCFRRAFLVRNHRGANARLYPTDGLRCGIRLSAAKTG